MIYKIITLITVIFAVYKLTRPIDIDVLKEKKKFIRKRGGISADQEEQHLVNFIIRRLVAFSGRPNLKYKLDVIATSELEACAFYPDHIFISRGLLFLAGDVDRIAAVLAHELVHVMECHSRQRLWEIKKISMINLLLSFLRLKPLTSMLTHYGSKYHLAARSRDAEREADAKAFSLLRNAGFRAQAMKEILERLDEMKGRGQTKPNIFGDLFASHPGLRERIDRLSAP